MYSQGHVCLAGCGKRITWSFAICSECEKIYGSSPYDWPTWLRYLWNETQRERRRAKKALNNETFQLPDIVSSAIPHKNWYDRN